MDYPIYIDGTECGVLTVEKNGLYTSISADCEIGEKLVRLYIYGEGKAKALGTLYPKDGRLHLNKRFSRTEMQCFPKNIEYASNTKIEKSTEESDCAEKDMIWFRTENGSLTAFDGEKNLTAIPCSDTLKAGRIVKIEGKSYIVFKSKRNLQ